MFGFNLFDNVYLSLFLPLITDNIMVWLLSYFIYFFLLFIKGQYFSILVFYWILLSMLILFCKDAVFVKYFAVAWLYC